MYRIDISLRELDTESGVEIFYIAAAQTHVSRYINTLTTVSLGSPIDPPAFPQAIQVSLSLSLFEAMVGKKSGKALLREEGT